MDITSFLLTIWTSCCMIAASATRSSSNFTREGCLSLERANSIRRSSKAVAVVENNPAYLHCTIGQSEGGSDNLVAWTRLTDDALLTAGGRSFTTDARFQISPKRQARDRDWVLIIRRVQKSDQGCYLCEVNTEPQTTFIPVYVEVTSEIESPQRLSSTQKRNTNLSTRMNGNILLLNCTVDGIQELLTEDGIDVDILWTKDNSPIDLGDNTKYSAAVSKDRGPHGNSFVYTLRISDVSSDDDGYYACEGEGFVRSAQMVHVNTNGCVTSTINNFHSFGLLCFTLIISFYL
ncbi:immunoglobulin v-set domain-containing protein [Ditylenchus destructor]|nr:immunoglobulin v-set domain-containing protein [Ditylenchus destructor]